MHIPSRIWEFVATSIVIIVAPGPTVLFIIARAVSWGRRTAVLTAAGGILGSFSLSAIIAVGLGPLLQRSALAYSFIQWGGGLYLIYLGIDSLRHRNSHASGMMESTGNEPTSFKSMREGFWVGVLNPKTLVFFAAILPQFIDRDQGSITAQLLFLGALFALMALISDGGWGLLAGTARNWLAGDTKRLIILRVIGGCVMVVLGTLVIFSAIARGTS